ncbi:MAG: aminoglycoside phosphotransferase family protein [Burkholderiaceae bacterium]
MPEDSRLESAKAWLNTLDLQGLEPASLRIASADASFRRYLRVNHPAQPNGHLVLMDAPPDKEPLEPFLLAADLMSAAGLHAPKRLALNADQGFLLLEDLGTLHYQQALDPSQPATATPLYRDAWKALVQLQRWGIDHAESVGWLTPYSHEKLVSEMSLFKDWYVAQHLHARLTDQETQALDAVCERLAERALRQPQVIVHRDYHCRNLLVCPGQNPGVIDFQDAVLGPISYDLVSLLRDAYVRWEEADQLDWAIGYWTDARAAGLPVSEDFADFWMDFEWMGLQRHLKVLGIFARLAYRDGKHQYLHDLPVVLRYTREVAQRYVAFGPLKRLLDRLHP